MKTIISQAKVLSRHISSRFSGSEYLASEQNTDADSQVPELNSTTMPDEATKSEGNRFFIITSSGRTASYWLAASLHEHADIICGHSLQMPPVPDYTKPMQWSDVQSILAEAGNSHWNFLSNSKRIFPDEYFDVLEKEGDARFYGCVHTYALHGLIECFAEQPPRRSFSVMHLTRHPVNRITSWKNRALEEWGHSSAAREFWTTMYQGSPPHLGLASYAKHEFGLDPNDNNVIAFICAVIDVAAETSGIGGKYVAVPMERLVSDPQYFIWFLKSITSPDLALSKNYIDKVYSKGKLNPSRNIAALPFIEFETWRSWERAIFKEACARWPIVQSFGPLGYDFSFLDDNYPEPISTH